MIKELKPSKSLGSSPGLKFAATPSLNKYLVTLKNQVRTKVRI